MLSLCFTIRPNASVQRWESSLSSEFLACLEESGVMTKKTNTNQCQRGGSWNTAPDSTDGSWGALVQLKLAGSSSRSLGVMHDSAVLLQGGAGEGQENESAYHRSAGAQ